jgi:hypothetical protein
VPHIERSPGTCGTEYPIQAGSTEEETRARNAPSSDPLTARVSSFAFSVFGCANKEAVNAASITILT